MKSIIQKIINMKAGLLSLLFIVLSIYSFSQGGWCTSTSLAVGGCESGLTSTSHSSMSFNSSCSGDETAEGFFWITGVTEGDSYEFVVTSFVGSGLGVSIFGVDGATCSAVNEINCTTSALGVISLPSVTLSGSDYYYMQVYTLDGSSLSSYLACASAATPTGGGGGGGGGVGVPPTEQDCDGAIPVCQDTYSESNAYSGEGNITGEISGSISCMQGEKNDVWYIFTTQSAGNICFDITPNQMTDDYDWAVYNITNSPCSAIATDPSLQVSCNWSSSAGITGPNGGSDTNDEPCIPVNNGETYVVNVSQFSTSSNGYNIDFSASTADMWDNSPPVFSGVISPAQGATSLEFNFSENVDCSSIDDSDFTLTGPGGPYTLSGITGNICSLGGSYEDVFTANVSPALTVNGTYDLCLISGAGVISDVCGNQANPACYSFTISSNPVCPVIDPLTPIEDCDQVILPPITGTDLTTSQAYFTGTGGTGTQYNTGDAYSVVGVTTLYAYDGVSGCDDEEELVVTVNPTPTVTVNNETICNGESATLTVTPSTPGGTYLWSDGSVPPFITVSPTSTTTYSVVYTLSSCPSLSVDGTVTVTEINTIALNSAVGTDAQTVCVSNSITDITYATTGATGGTVAGLPAGVTGSWSSDVFTITGTPTSSVGSPFSYTVTLTGGCGTVTETGTITVTDVNTIALSSAFGTDAQTVCVSNAITDITYATTGATGGTVTGLPAGVTGSWSTDVFTITGTPTSSVGSPFSYTVTLTGGCGTVTETGTITVTPLPVYIDFTSNCTGATLDNVEVNATAPSGTLEYSLDDITYQASNIFTGLTSGNSYTFYIRIVGTTCSVNSSLQAVSCNCSVVSGNTIGSSETICEGDVASTLVGTVPTITPTASSTYQWQSSIDNSTWTDIAGGTTQDYSPGTLTQTTYFRRVVKMVGCPDNNSSSVEVTVTPLPVYVDFTSNCTGATLDNIEINATTTSGTLEYSLDDVTYQASNVFTGLTSGNSYTFYVRIVGNTCSVNSGLQAVSCNCSVVSGNTIGSDETICVGGVASILTGSTPTITPLTSSTYQWQSSIDNLTWSDIAGGTTQDYSPGALTQTTYFRRVVKMVGCPDDNSASVEITVNPLPVYVDFTSNCTGATLDNVEVNATTTSGTLEYSLDDVTYQASNVFTGLTPGNSYTFYVRIVGNTCSVNSGLQAVSCNCSVVSDNTISSDETICVGDIASTLVGTVPTITPSAPSTYQWQSSLDNSTWSDISGETSQDYSPGALTQTTYFRRVLKMVGCPDDNSAAVEVTVIPTIIAEAGVDDEIVCLPSSVDLDGTGSTVSGVDYLWTGPVGGILFGETTLTPTVNIGGVYTLTVTDQINGCSVSDFVTITENNTPPTVITQSASTEITCDNPVVTIDGTLSSQGANWFYSWDEINNNGNILTPDDAQTIDVDAPGTYRLFVFDFNTLCIDFSTIVITEDVTTLNLQVTPVPDVCQSEDSLDLSSYVNISGGEYTGLGISTASSSILDLTASTGINSIDYTVVNPSNGCSTTEVIDVNVLANPVIVFSADTIEGCLPLQVTLTDDNPEVADLCVWDFGDGNQSNSCGNASNTYNVHSCFDVSLTKTFANGCSSSETLSNYICTNPIPVSDFIADNNEVNSMDTKVQFENYSIDGDEYIWDFGDDVSIDDPTLENPEHEFPEHEALYNVTLIAISDEGCRDTSTLAIKVIEEEVYYVPNSFTPNGDGINQVFKPEFSTGVSLEDFSLYIYNRWGEIVFESHDINKGWDGTYGVNGDVQQSGLYIWTMVIKAKTSDKVTQVSGQVNLLK